MGATDEPVKQSMMRFASIQGLRLLWHVTRLPVLATLLILEPPIRVLLSTLTLLGIAMSLCFEYILRLPHFPFWPMLGLSIGCAALLVPYYGLIRLFSFTPRQRS
jgi:hypothetical protein